MVCERANYLHAFLNSNYSNGGFEIGNLLTNRLQTTDHTLCQTVRINSSNSNLEISNFEVPSARRVCKSPELHALKYELKKSLKTVKLPFFIWDT